VISRKEQPDNNDFGSILLVIIHLITTDSAVHNTVVANVVAIPMPDNAADAQSR